MGFKSTLHEVILPECIHHMWAGINILFPDVCVGCESPLHYEQYAVCRHCEELIESLEGPVCKRCSRELGPYGKKGTVCSDCARGPIYIDRCVALVRYTDVVKRIMHAVKFEKRRSLLKAFTPYIENTFITLRSELHDAVIVPVPLSRKRQHARDFNQSAIVAQMIRSVTSLPLKHALQCIHDHQPQSTLSRTERLHNLVNSFTCTTHLVQGKHVLLVDDIITTGSTINACAKVLSEHGASYISVCALARAL